MEGGEVAGGEEVIKVDMMLADTIEREDGD